MSKKDKLIAKLLNDATVLTFNEADRVLKQHGFFIEQSDGSGMKYIYKNDESIFLILHRPHPGNEIKNYTKKRIICVLKKVGVV